MSEPIKRVLITGGAGFIGSHLAEAFLARGDRVCVIDNLSTGKMENIAGLVNKPRFEYTVDSVMNEPVINDLVQETDLVVHLAAAVGVELIVKDPVQVIETNILGTHSVLKAAQRHHKMVLLASTSEIYGKSDQMPFREDDDRVLGPTTKARWSYSDSKAIDEFLGLAYQHQLGLPVIIFRLFNTIGPRQTGQYGMVAPRFVQQALSGKPISVFGDGQQRRCFCDVQDVVRAIVALADCPEAAGHVFNIGNTEEITILHLAELVLDIVHSSGSFPSGNRNHEVVFVPYEVAYEPGFEDMRRRIPDISRIKSLTGWEPRISLPETLSRIVAFFREEAVTHGAA